MNREDFIYGLRPVMEAIESGKNIDKLLVRRDITADPIKELVKKAREYEILIQKVPVEKLNRITMKNHQGVIAIMSPVVYHKLDNLVADIYEQGKTPLAVLLDGVTDAGNFGAIARSAECAGADFIVIPERGSATATPDAIRSSAGALLHVPVCRVKDISSSVTVLQENGYKIVGASEKGTSVFTDVDFTVPVGIVMGAEDKGINFDVIKKCDELAAIPIKGKVGSLNVSVAAGVMLYEAVKQRLGISCNEH